MPIVGSRSGDRLPTIRPLVHVVVGIGLCCRPRAVCGSRSLSGRTALEPVVQMDDALIRRPGQKEAATSLVPGGDQRGE